VVGILSQFLEVHFTNFVWAVIVASPVIGSFLGVVVERLPAGRQFLWGRSQCDACGHTLGVLDLIPFASWLHSQGRCRYCRAELSAFYPLIELAALLVAIWAATATTGLWFIASCVIGWTLLVAATIDWHKRRRAYSPLLALIVWLACLYGPTILKLLGQRAS
jgi:prepilin signal peptidase PulO-like enzyme (type II secretory pathway)